ncbi:MAG: aldo/keto reductase, partial [Candidatus Tectomicrobia bacterium]|nr:aldo/keto reductase [Candidatus Tectomicrobia bacterium]
MRYRTLGRTGLRVSEVGMGTLEAFDVPPGRRAILATKVRESGAAAARASIERSFERLRTEALDLLQVHNMAGWREVLPVLEEYRERGRVRFLGLTYYERESEPEVLAAMRTGRFDAVQVPCWL